MPPNIIPHDLVMGFDGSGTQPGEVNAGDTANDAAGKGKHVYYFDSKEYGFPNFADMKNSCRLAIHQGDPNPSDSSPGRFISSVYGHDPAETDFEIGQPQEYQPHHYNGQEYWYSFCLTIPDHAVLPGDPVNGGWDKNNDRPSVIAKLAEISHADTWIDGNVPNWPSNGHNALGLVATRNGAGIPQQFGGPRPSANNSVAQSSDWRVNNFIPASNDPGSYWTFTYDGGDVSAHDNTNAWAWRPVVANESMWFVIRLLKHDYSGKMVGGIGDTTQGIIEGWAISDAERLACKTINDLLAIPSLMYYAGSTNPWVSTTDLSCWDANSPAARWPHGGSPLFGRYRPTYPFAGIAYFNSGTLTSSFADFVSVASPMKRRQTKLATFSDLLVSSPTPPVMTNAQLAAASWNELTKTTDSYPAWVKKNKPPTHWANAKNYLDQIK